MFNERFLKKVLLADDLGYGDLSIHGHPTSRLYETFNPLGHTFLDTLTFSN